MCHCQEHSCGSANVSGCGSKQCQCSCHKIDSGCHSNMGCCGGGHLSHHVEDHHDDYVTRFLQLADAAWMEVLKEKIKENIRSNSKGMDELARLITEANHDRWHMKMENKRCVNDYEQKIRSYFNETCQTHGQKR